MGKVADPTTLDATDAPHIEKKTKPAFLTYKYTEWSLQRRIHVTVYVSDISVTISRFSFLVCVFFFSFSSSVRLK